MGLIHKLILFLSNHNNSSLTRLLENIVIKKLKSDLANIDYQNINSDMFLHYRTLVVINQKDSRKKFTPEIAYFIYKKRLIKYIIFILNPLKKDDPSTIYAYSRLEFLFFTVKNFKLINSAISQHIWILDLDSKNFCEYQIIDSKNIFNKVNILNKYSNYTKFMFEPNWKIKIKNGTSDYVFSNFVLTKLIFWNSHRTLLFIKKLNLDNDCEEFLSRFFPPLLDSLKTFEKLSLQIMPGADLNLDNSFEKNIVQILSDSEIWNQSLIIKDKSLVVIDETYIPRKEIASGLYGAMIRYNYDSKNVLVRRSNNLVKQINVCAFLSYRVDTNYFHFLLDTLPKLIILNDLPDSVPFLIRDDLPSDFKNIIKRLTNRNLIEVSSNDVISIDKLFICTAISSVFDFKTDNSSNRINFPFKSINKLRIQLLNISKATTIKHDYVYIHRGKSSTKNVINYQSVISLLEKYNFSIIQMDKNFYNEQIQIFSNAKIVVASGGAVLSNLIFINPNAKIIILESFFSHQLGLWRNLAEGLKVNANYVLGPRFSIRKKKNRIHSNYFVPIRKLRKIVEREITSVT